MSAVALQSFGFGEQLVRVVDRAGGVWFVANDICAALELSNPRKAVSSLDSEERDGVTISDAMGRLQETTIISESGLYALIFRSRKPIAVQFRKWVTGEVLPAIRKTGHYEAAPANDVVLDDAPSRRDAMSVNLAAVRMMYTMYGSAAALELWRERGLPLTPAIEKQISIAQQRLGKGQRPDAEEVVQIGPLWRWTSECSVTPNPAVARPTYELWQEYAAWCGVRGFQFMDPPKFGEGLRNTFGKEDRRGIFNLQVGKSSIGTGPA